MYASRRGDVIIALALHASFNASSGLCVVSEQPATDPGVQFMAQGVLAALLVAATVARTVRYGSQLARPMSEPNADGQLN